MAARRQTGVIGPSRPRVVARPVNEDYYKPISEWKEEESSLILRIHLPGFKKDTIKVQTQNSNTIKVRGERQVAGDRRGILQEDFLVPQNGDISQIRAKFEAEILTITVAKKTVIATPPAVVASKTTQQPSKPDSAQQRNAKSTLPPTPTTIPRPQKAASEPPQNVASTNSPKVASTTDVDQKQTDGESLPKATGPQKGQDPTSSNAKIPEKALEKTVEKEKESSEKIKNSVEAENVVDKKTENTSSESIVSEAAKGKPTESKMPQEALEKLVDPKGKDPIKSENVVAKIDDQESGKSNDRVGVDAHAEKAEEYSAAAKTKDIPAAAAGSKLGNFKQAVMGLPKELNQERQLAVNMGVAVLVIVALGAYISYSFGSSPKATN